MIPKEHRQMCEHCNRIFDARDFGQVIAHIKGDCDNVQEIKGVTARKVGDPVEWKDGKRIDLN